MHTHLSQASALIINRVKSVGESSGSVAHALGYRLPIICPKDMAISEMAGEAGIFYENTKESKKSVLERFIADAELRKMLADSAHQVAQKIDFERVAREIAKLVTRNS
jgi:glycosyltransferase involved in cell wall biosynthesis